MILDQKARCSPPTWSTSGWRADHHRLGRYAPGEALDERLAVDDGALTAYVTYPHWQEAGE